jgi:SAM-dependent methyltransferase
MPLPRQSTEWYDRLPALQEGYYYPWRSRLGEWNGEEEYLTLVRQHLRPEADVLDVACGHGEVALMIAPSCRSVLGYDRMAAWVALGRQAARDRDLANVTFICHDSSAAANDGRPRLPAPDASFDLLICRRGPFHWIEDARRVGRPGAALLMLVPDATPLTPWHAWLPEPLQWEPASDPHWARPAIERRLTPAGLTIHSWWSFDVPELFPDPEQLYIWLAWGYTPDEIPSLAEIYPVLERIFNEYGGSDGVELRRRRYLWKSILPA